MLKKVLVTGSNGQLGSTIKELSINHDINFVFASSSELDITNKKQLVSLFNEISFDYCINCAAYTKVDKAEQEIEKAYSINSEAVKNLALNCSQHNVILIHISTDFVFDGEKESPYIEADATNPINVYGKSKLQGEKHIQEILENYFIFRTSWLYSKYGNNFVKTIIRLSKEKEEINIVSDQIGSPTNAEDLAIFILRIIKQESTHYGLYHFSNNDDTSWYGFAQKILSHYNRDTILNPIPSHLYPTLAKRPKYSVLNTKKVETTFGINILNWDDSLNKMLSDYVR